MGEAAAELVHMETGQDRFAVHIAAHEGDLANLRTALEFNVRFAAFDSSGRTPLFYAAAQNHVDCCTLLLESRSDLLNLGDTEGDRPLHVAAYYGHKEALRLFMAQADVDVNASNNKGFTALHVCSCVESCKQLMDNGGDLFALDEKSRVPLFTACATNRRSVVTEILNNPRFDTKTMLMIQDSFGDSPLHAAACNGSLDCIKTIKGFIDLDLIRLTNHQGYTAEDLSRLNQQTECANYINELSATLFKARQQHDHMRLAQNSWAGQFDNLPFDGAAGSGARPDTSGGGIGGMGGGFARPQTTAGFGGGFDPRSTFHGGSAGGQLQPLAVQPLPLGQQQEPHMQQAGARPQSAQSYNEFGGALPALGQADWAGVFERPYDDDPYASSAEFEASDEERANTPWTMRRQQAEIHDWRGEWAQFVDKETGQVFWWNSISGESQWEEPLAAEGAGEEAGEAGEFEFGEEAEISEAEQVRQRAFVRCQILQWSECEDSITGDVFFYNNDTGECEWELPPEAEDERRRQVQAEAESVRQSAEAEAQELVWASANGGESSDAAAASKQRALKESFKAEATAEITQQLRAEFDEKMKVAVEQTAKLAKRMESDDRQEKVKAELLAEHKNEVDKLAMVLSADRLRQNDELQKTLQERRRLRALKRNQVMNQAKEARSPKHRALLLMSPSGGDSVRSGLPTPLSGTKGPNSSSRRLPPVASPHKTKQVTVDELLAALTGPKCEDLAVKAVKQMELLTRVHAQFFRHRPSPKSLHEAAGADDDGKKEEKEETEEKEEAEGDGGDSGKSEARAEPTKFGEATCLDKLLWVIFNTHALPSASSGQAGLSQQGFRGLLDLGTLKLLISERDALLSRVYASDPQLRFPDFKRSLGTVMQAMGCDARTFCKELIIPACVHASLALRARSKIYQQESKRLATDVVRKILQSNVSQLKLVYLYYSLVAEKRAHEGCPKKTLTLAEVLGFANDFDLAPKHCSKADVVNLHLDGTLRKPGTLGSLESKVVPFNQFVQLLFHIGLRCFKAEDAEERGGGGHGQADADADADAGLDGKERRDTKAIGTFLEVLNKAGKRRMKKFKPFIHIQVLT